ncbi:MAG: flagellar protein export ATPase FliI [Bacillota bacterium]
MNFEKYLPIIQDTKTIVYKGKVDKIIGLVIESTGPHTNIGEVCRIYLPREEKYILGEVVGFKEQKVLLMPFEDIAGIGPGCVVESTGNVLQVPVGDKLIGRTIDGFGRPIDGMEELGIMPTYSVQNKPSNPLSRPRIATRINIGVKAIDSLLTCGRGQRMGIFSGSGVGKSTLLGMIARNIEADINVIALVGERGREVRDFIEKDLGPEGMKRSVLVVATSDQPAMMRLKCSLVATTIAEYFRDQGKNVLLLMDSLTRFAMAQREIGLAIGEPPVARGYTPSIYSMLPKLLERSGNFETGSITGIYTVLVEGDDVNEPISDTVRGIIDGHIVLSRAIAMRNHYPAIDILASISRLMSELVDPLHLKCAGEIRRMLAVYNNNSDLISIGAYKSGSNPELDKAIGCIEQINSFLQQRVEESFSYEETMELMKSIIPA